MRKFIFHSLLFTFPIFVVIMLNFKYAPYFIRYELGPGTDEQIDRSFTLAESRTYDCLALGNSRIYRGLNPDLVSIPTFNFANDDGSFNQYYFKLLYLDKKRKKFKYLILGMDYFEFSYLPYTRNHVYFKYLGDGYKKDYQQSIQSIHGLTRWLLGRDFFSPLNTSFNSFMSKKFAWTALSCSKYIFRALQGKPRFMKAFLRDNGQYVIAFSFALENDSLIRDLTRLPIQDDYFNKILKFCSDRGIKVILVMAPARSNELDGYNPDTIMEYERYFQRKTKPNEVFYLNYSTHPSFTVQDFSDITHLTENGANKWSDIFDGDLNKIMKTQIPTAS
ncbi:MAG: hypothetical protein LHV69_00815 [Elusimicrobia bacterium]|nr:hypothetical protein [Candidatus Obscuribacterium magneticum]